MVNESLSSGWGHLKAAGGNRWHCHGAACEKLGVLSLTVVAVALSPPRYLSFSELSHASVLVSWEAASPAVKAHHVTYVSSRGSNAGEVSPQGAGGRKRNLGGQILPCSPSAAWFGEGLSAGSVLTLK